MKPDEKHHVNDDDLRRLIAADWWKWMPGMKAAPPGQRGAVITAAMCTSEEGWQLRDPRGSWSPAKGLLPVPSDPATAGCLLELYLRQSSREDIGLYDLTWPEPGPEAYASFGDFMVAVLLDIEGNSR